jgi:hypothetical protein
MPVLRLTKGTTMSDTTTTTEERPALTDEQRTRTAALKVARAVMVKNGLLSAEVTIATSDLVELAEYIVSGANPLDRYETAEVEVSEDIVVEDGPGPRVTINYTAGTPEDIAQALHEAMKRPA